MYKYIKRVLDIIFSLILLLVLFLPMILIIILIVLIDREKPFFTQIRTGKNGKEFKLYKFRSIGKDRKYTKVGKIIRSGIVTLITTNLTLYCKLVFQNTVLMIIKVMLI